MSFFGKLTDKATELVDDMDTRAGRGIRHVSKKTGLSENVVGTGFVIAAAAVGAKAGAALGAGHVLSAASTIGNAKKALNKATDRLDED